MKNSLTYTTTKEEKAQALSSWFIKNQEKMDQAMADQKKMAKDGKIILLDSSFFINEDHNLCQRCVDVASIEIDGIDGRDYPDFSDAFVSAARWEDGTRLTEDELNELESQHPDLVYERISDAAFNM